MDEEQKPNLSIVIPHRGGWDVLRRCLEAIHNRCRRPLEILVVDTGAEDDSIARARSAFPTITVIGAGSDSGYAGGCNAGIRRATSPLVLLLNNDAFVEPGCVEALVDAAADAPDAAAWQPKVLSATDPRRFDYAGAAGGYLDRYATPFARGRIFDRIETDRGQYDTRTDLLWGSGACLLLNRRAVDEAGYMDETFVNHMEEIDLCWRLALQGLQTVFVPEARVLHLGGATLDRNAPHKTYLNHRNSLSMLVKNASSRSLLWSLPGRLALDLAAFGYHIVHGRWGHAAAVARAVVAAALRLPDTLRERRRIQRRRTVPDDDLSHLIYPGSIAAAAFLREVKAFSDLGWNAGRCR